MTTRREQLAQTMIDEVTNRDRVEAARHATAEGRLWKAADRALKTLQGHRTRYHLALWLLQVALRQLLALGVPRDALDDLLHANVAAYHVKAELDRQRAEAAQLEN